MRILSVCLLIISLSGCHLFSQSPSPISAANEKSATQVVEPPPILIKRDWHDILSPLINALTQFSMTDEYNLLLLSDVKNNSHDYIDSNQINQVLNRLFAKQTLFLVVDKKLVNDGKQLLGIANDDTLVSRGKMIALARNINVNYVLFTTINAPPKPPYSAADVEMELLFSQTGEIIWSLSSSQLTDNNEE